MIFMPLNQIINLFLGKRSYKGTNLIDPEANKLKFTQKITHKNVTYLEQKVLQNYWFMFFNWFSFGNWWVSSSYTPYPKIGSNGHCWAKLCPLLLIASKSGCYIFTDFMFSVCMVPIWCPFVRSLRDLRNLKIWTFKLTPVKLEVKS